MLTFLAAWYEKAYVLLRVVAGSMYAFHGARKLFGLLDGYMPEIGTQLWVGGVIELVAGTCIVLGLLAHWASLIASATLAFAYVQFHWRLDLGVNAVPAKNQGELAVLYCVVFLMMTCRGAGHWSIDDWMRKRSGPPPAH
jgi:putative oxidoreductase